MSDNYVIYTERMKWLGEQAHLGRGGTDGGDRRRIVVLGHGESYTTLGCKQHREILGVGDVIQLMRGMGEGGYGPMVNKVMSYYSQECVRT